MTKAQRRAAIRNLKKGAGGETAKKGKTKKTLGIPSK